MKRCFGMNRYSETTICVSQEEGCSWEGEVNQIHCNHCLASIVALLQSS